MTSIHAPSRRPVLLAPGQGEARWLGGHLLDWKLHGRDSGGQLAAVETVIPRGQEPPLHVHEHDDELFYVLEGEATFICGDAESTGGPGSTAYLPRGVPHTLRVESATVRALVVMTPSPRPYFEALSVPATSRTLPAEPAHVDPAAIEAALAEVGIRVVGPPPGR